MMKEGFIENMNELGTYIKTLLCFTQMLVSLFSIGV